MALNTEYRTPGSDSGQNRLSVMSWPPAVDALGTTRYTYDAAGQRLSEDGPFDNDTVTYSYSNRLRTGLTLEQPADSWWTSFGYDSAKRPTSATSLAGEFDYSYTRLSSGFSGRLVSQIGLPNGAGLQVNAVSLGELQPS